MSKENKLPNLIILGPQGSGKGTQAKIIADKYGYQILGTGNLIRKRTEQKDRFADQLKQIINSGKLVPNNYLFKIFESAFLKIDKSKPIIFDGIPRNTEQAEKLNQLLNKYKINQPKVVYLYISDYEAKKRITTRKICPKCLKIFDPTIVGFKKGICPKCNEKLITREDDQPKAVEKRLKIFHQETEPILKYYQQKKQLVKIDGTPKIKKVTKSIYKKIFND